MVYLLTLKGKSYRFNFGVLKSNKATENITKGKKKDLHPSAYTLPYTFPPAENAPEGTGGLNVFKRASPKMLPAQPRTNGRSETALKSGVYKINAAQ